jgi:hypothetical protein
MIPWNGHGIDWTDEDGMHNGCRGIVLAVIVSCLIWAVIGVLIVWVLP